MHRKNLVLPRVGRKSLHSTWLGASETRSWDLYLCPFQPLEPPESDVDLHVGEVLPGPKWTGLRQLLNSWDGWRGYDYIWLPDDDIYTSEATIDRLFDVASALSLDLCAPALQEASYYAHYTTMRNRRCSVRRTGFVEIMVPCFSRPALERLLPTLDLTTTGWGWGLDSLWPKLLGYQNLGVIDDAAVLHTRPVGAFRDPELGRRVLDESDRIMLDHDCRQVHTVFSALGPDLRPLNLTPEALTATLADGWHYLFDANPSVLPWLVDAQAPSGGWPVYPVGGAPSTGAPVASGAVCRSTP